LLNGVAPDRAFGAGTVVGHALISVARPMGAGAAALLSFVGYDITRLRRMSFCRNCTVVCFHVAQVTRARGEG
jgi:hypothetical protein